MAGGRAEAVPRDRRVLRRDVRSVLRTRLRDADGRAVPDPSGRRRAARHDRQVDRVRRGGGLRRHHGSVAAVPACRDRGPVPALHRDQPVHRRVHRPVRATPRPYRLVLRHRRADAAAGGTRAAIAR